MEAPAAVVDPSRARPLFCWTHAPPLVGRHTRCRLRVPGVWASAIVSAPSLAFLSLCVSLSLSPLMPAASLAHIWCWMWLCRVFVPGGWGARIPSDGEVSWPASARRRQSPPAVDQLQPFGGPWGAVSHHSLTFNDTGQQPQQHSGSQQQQNPGGQRATETRCVVYECGRCVCLHAFGET